MKHLVFVFVVAAVPMAADAQSITGNDLLTACGGKNDPALAGFCTGYVLGVIEGMKWGAALPSLLQQKSAGQADAASSAMLGFCIPEAVTVQQEIDVAAQFLQRHPEERHNSARLLMQSALHEAFPCE